MTTTTAPEVGAAEDEQPVDHAGSHRPVLWFAAVLVMLVLLHAFVIEPVRVRSDSMEPTLSSGAMLPDRQGDIPRSRSSARRSDRHHRPPHWWVDRQADRCNRGRLGRDRRRPVDRQWCEVDEDYIENSDMDGFFFGPDVVPAGHVFLLGDNRADSVDSRAFGPVAVDDIEGRVLARLWG